MLDLPISTPLPTYLFCSNVRCGIREDKKWTGVQHPETFSMTLIPLYLQLEHVSSFETWELFCLSLYLKHIKRAAFHGKSIIVSKFAFLSDNSQGLLRNSPSVLIE